MKIFTNENFTTMPWKNGGGLTTELFSIGNPFKFRISMASIKSNGPFSIYPGIDRTLLLLEGTGFKLTDQRTTTLINQVFSPIEFSGENVIECTLVQNECRDFNIMVDRSFGRTKTSIISYPLKINNSNPGKTVFVFDFWEMKLFVLGLEDSMSLSPSANAPLIMIELNEN